MSRCALLLALLVGCVSPADDLVLSQTSQLATVGNSTGGCSTSVVIGLSKQIADEVSCMKPNGLVRFQASSKVSITSNAVLPYLAKGAKDDLFSAANQGSLQINSAFRTIAQQYLLVKWHDQGRCGITATAPVGTSNHESGRAIDVANYGSRIGILGNHGWAHTVPGDDVHFDHLASPDIRGLDTKAFQRLWNRNHPDDKIAEDGDYGPQTASRLARSPAEGFALGASCVGTNKVEVVAVNGPDKAPPAAQVHYALRLKNIGTAEWPASTQIVTADEMPSALADTSWDSPKVVGMLREPVAPNETATFELDVTTPDVAEDTPVQQLFALKNGTKVFGQIELAVTVALDADETPMEGNEESDDMAADGGCNAGGSTGGAAWLVGALAVVLGLRRRRQGTLALLGAATVALAACEAPAADEGDAGDTAPDAGITDVDAAPVTEDEPAPALPPIKVLRGVDRASAFTVAQAKLLKTDHGVKWTGVYIGGACSAGSGWTKARVKELHAATSWQFMPIWVGQQSSAICSAHTLTAAQGTADGEATVAKMKAYGWKPDRSIPVALDVEGGTFNASNTGSNAYVKAWTKAVHAGGYLAYVYSSPYGINYFHDHDTKIDGAWVASWFFSGFHASDPSDLTQIGSRYSHQNRAWQYAGDFSVAGVGTVDANVSELRLAPVPE